MPNYEYAGRNTQTFQKLPGYKNIAAWQAASDLTAMVGRLVSQYGPAHYRVANQMRGAAISVSGNIAEGYCSGSLPNYIRYCNHARGSLGELGSYLQDCEREGLTHGEDLSKLLKQYSTATFLLDRLLHALVKKEQSGTWDNNYWVKEQPASYAGRSDDFPYADIGLNEPLDSETGATT